MGERGGVVFVDVDTQHDFLDESGSLYVPRSVEIVPVLARLTRFAREKGIPVLASACAHRLDDPEPEPFPPHCLVGTEGQRRVSATFEATSRVLGPDERLDPGEPLPRHLTIEKRHYDLFTHGEAERIVSWHREGRDPLFVVYGVATDYCVKAAVEGLLDRGARVVVVVDAVRAVDAEAEPAILTEFVERGAGLVVAERVCHGTGLVG